MTATVQVSVGEFPRRAVPPTMVVLKARKETTEKYAAAMKEAGAPPEASLVLQLELERREKATTAQAEAFAKAFVDAWEGWAKLARATGSKELSA
eukprot:CAMPEP_0183810890 /NCGR_PEP_ID=MMETSP0803_2-20130417/48344_1 /TAXON_ID=195967 /ORGANISM="Crustomastix stigmata, Strain CCMP3273" /LENGTH=94 /DNA_ID=CAMNT_0026055717 /DNA_START=65 /DNA_END=345 /DNA_ORIENTATION=-